MKVIKTLQIINVSPLTCLDVQGEARDDAPVGAEGRPGRRPLLPRRGQAGAPLRLRGDAGLQLRRDAGAKSRPGVFPAGRHRSITNQVLETKFFIQGDGKMTENFSLIFILKLILFIQNTHCK